MIEIMINPSLLHVHVDGFPSTTGKWSCNIYRGTVLGSTLFTGGAWSKGRSHLDHCLLIGWTYIYPIRAQLLHELMP